MSNTNESIAWDNIIKKEARGTTDDSDFGEVQDLGQGFDGGTLWFNASQDQLQGWKRDSPPDDNEYSQYKTQETPSDIETRIPLIEERLNVSKNTSTSEATITKEPVTETKTVEVPVTHEELTIERRPPSESSSSTAERPVQSKTDTKVQLN